MSAPKDGKGHVVEVFFPSGWAVARWTGDHYEFMDNSRVPGTARAVWDPKPYLYPSEQDAQSALTFWESSGG